MKRYIGGEFVEKGKYYNFATRRLAELGAAGKLPGGPNETYRKVNSAMMIIMAPLATLLFIILLPVAYVAAFTTLWGYKLLRLMLGMGHGHGLAHRH